MKEDCTNPSPLRWLWVADDPEVILPETLSLHAGVRATATATYCRVIRIAVDEPFRRHRYGSALLEGITKDARARGMDFVGASFGIFAGSCQLLA